MDPLLCATQDSIFCVALQFKGLRGVTTFKLAFQRWRNTRQQTFYPAQGWPTRPLEELGPVSLEFILGWGPVVAVALSRVPAYHRAMRPQRQTPISCWIWLATAFAALSLYVLSAAPMERWFLGPSSVRYASLPTISIPPGTAESGTAVVREYWYPPKWNPTPRAPSPSDRTAQWIHGLYAPVVKLELSGPLSPLLTEYRMWWYSR